MLCRYVICVGLTALALVSLCEIAVSAEPLRIGVAETDITPPEGFPLAGYYHERLATGVRDPLKAKAVVFRGSGREAAFVVADLTGVSRDLYLEVRKRAAVKTGIPEEHIVLSATHSHTGPDYYRHLYDYLRSPELESGAAPYPAKLIDGIVNAIANAHAGAVPAIVEAGSALQQQPVSFNRRFLMEDGSIRTWQRLDTPQVLRAAGPIDPEIGLLLIRGAEDRAPRGLVSNFALHLDTVGGTLWSADYPYFIEQSIRKELGSKVVSVFGAGTCGDINHADPVAKERNSTETIGNSLGATIVAGLSHLKPVENQEFQVRSSVVRLPLAKVTEQDLERAQQLLPAAKAGEKVEFFDQVAAYKAAVLDRLQHAEPRESLAGFVSLGVSHAWGGIGNTLLVEVTTMTIGNEVALVFLPGEVFVDLGLAIKRGSPYRTTLVVELSNCVETIYIPTRAAYVGGGYEVTNSLVEPGSGEMLVEAALRSLRDSASQP